MLETLKRWADAVTKETLVLWFACRHPVTPAVAKLLALATVAYALSPIDLIPDFIPVLGYLDDLLILPVMIYITVRLIPAPVLADCRRQSEEWIAARRATPKSYAGAIAIIGVWLLLIGSLGWIFRDEIGRLF